MNEIKYLKVINPFEIGVREKVETFFFLHYNIMKLLRLLKMFNDADVIQVILNCLC